VEGFAVGSYDEPTVELGTLNWTVGLAVCGFGFWTAAVVMVAVAVEVVAWSLIGGGLNEVGLTIGLAVEKVVDGIGFVDCDIVVEYEDDIEPVGGELLLMLLLLLANVGFVLLETDISVYWVRDVDVDVVVDGVDDTAN